MIPLPYYRTGDPPLHVGDGILLLQELMGFCCMSCWKDRTTLSLQIRVTPGMGIPAARYQVRGGE